MGKSSDKADRDWFIEQVRREQTGLRAFVRMLGVRAEVVDDIAQDAFLIAFRKLGEFERETNFGAWLRAIARNLACNELRSDQRRQRIIGELVATELASDPAQSTLSYELAEERLEAMTQCLQELPQRSRRLVQQRYFERLTPAVIASHEGTNPNHINQMLFRLRAALKECIEGRLAPLHPEPPV
jgi:RNA polymerase sigma-70 factor (ECF subfamily)